MSAIYQVIVLLAALVVLAGLLTEKSLKFKLQAALVLIPLVLRALKIA
jgi:uncharacterized membrane protein YwaF